MWLSLLGKKGLADVARASFSRSEYLKKKLSGLKGYQIRFTGPTYDEFVLECPRSAAKIVDALGPRKIVPGVPLSRFYGKAFENSLLVCATEMRSRAELDALAEALLE